MKIVKSIAHDDSIDKTDKMANNNPNGEAKKRNAGVDLSGSGAVAVEGGVAAGEKGVAIGGDFSGNVYINDKAAKKQVIPRQGPTPPSYYIERAEERLIAEALVQQQGKPVVVLYGLSGVGKTALAAHLVKTEKIADAFADGVLWGDLNNYEPAEQLASFLASLDEPGAQASRSETSQRDQFWQVVAEKQMLIVVDNVLDPVQVAKQLLPRNGLWPRRCRLLLIGITQFGDQEWIERQVQLKVFTEAEALLLFGQYMGEAQVEPYRESLQEIARLVEYRPDLVVNNASRLATGQTLPYALLQQLQRNSAEPQIVRQQDWETYSLVLRALTPVQVHLLEMTAVMGRGDFSQAMVAAVALTDGEATKEALAGLVQASLLQRTEQGRYARNRALMRYLEQRLQQREVYQQEAAAHLLARFCHDLVQDLASKYQLDIGGAVASEQIDDERMQQFGQELLPEISHLRQVMEWALKREEWNIIARFAFIPYLGTLQNLIVNGGHTVIELMMATVANFVGWQRGEKTTFRLSKCLGQAIRFEVEPGKVQLAGEKFYFAFSETRIKPTRPEFTINASASQISSFVLCQAALIDSTWLGVRATGLLLRDTDVVGCQFIACELKESVWKGCDARNTKFTGSNLSYAVLRYIKLRGADLRQVNLTGAVLDNVDLRGANLQGANLTGVIMINLNLISCNLTDVQWAGAQGNIFVGEDHRDVIEEINRSAAQIPATPLDYPNNPPVEIARGVTRRFERVESTGLNHLDMRVADFGRVDISNSGFNHTQLQGADFSNANISKSGFNDTQLQGVDFSDTNISKSGFNHTQLQGADFSNASISKSGFNDAVMYSTYWVGATFKDSGFNDADLRFADLSQTIFISCGLNGANLREAILTDTQLVAGDIEGADLQRAILIGTNFRNAHLCFADLSQAQISGVDWHGADLAFADLRGTWMTSEMLAGARLFGTILDGGIDLREVPVSIGDALGAVALQLRGLIAVSADSDIDDPLLRAYQQINNSVAAWSALRNEIMRVMADWVRQDKEKAREILLKLQKHFTAIGVVALKIEDEHLHYHEIPVERVEHVYKKLAQYQAGKEPGNEAPTTVAQ